MLAVAWPRHHQSGHCQICQVVQRGGAAASRQQLWHWRQRGHIIVIFVIIVIVIRQHNVVAKPVSNGNDIVVNFVVSNVAQRGEASLS